MYDSRSQIIKQHETPVDDDGKHREYVVYKKDEVYITECVEWRIKSETTSGGSREFYAEFKNEKDAIGKYEKLLSAWEHKN